MERAFDILHRALANRGIAQHATAAQITHAAEQYLLERAPELRTFLRSIILKDCLLTCSFTHPAALQIASSHFAQLEQYLSNNRSLSCHTKLHVRGVV